MTKTQTELLVEARRTGHVDVQSGYITGRRKGAYGARRRDAAVTLCQMGLLEFVSREYRVLPLSNRTSADRSTSTIYRLTDAGRAAI